MPMILAFACSIAFAIVCAFAATMMGDVLALGVVKEPGNTVLMRAVLVAGALGSSLIAIRFALLDAMELRDDKRKKSKDEEVKDER